MVHSCKKAVETVTALASDLPKSLDVRSEFSLAEFMNFMLSTSSGKFSERKGVHRLEPSA